MKNTIIKIFSILIVSSMVLSGCIDSNTDSSNNTTTNIENLNLQDNQEDSSIEIGTSDAKNIILNGDTVQCDDTNVDIKNSVITIKSAGIYNIVGTLNDGQIVVDCSKNEKVELILNNVDINCSTSSPIYVISADKTIINLADNSVNSISDVRNATEDSDTPNSAIYSKDDLTIKGNGSLNITADYNNGIVSKDDLKITGGTINIIANNNAIKGKDSVTIKNGTFNIICNGDGIKTDNIEESEKGYIYIENGNFTIDSQENCLKSDTYTTILDGTFNLTSANGYTTASAHIDNMNIGGMFGNFNPEDMQRPQDDSMPNMEDFNPEDMQPPQDDSMPNMEDFNPKDMQPPQDDSMPNMEDFNPEDMQPPQNDSIPNSENVYNDIQTQTTNDTTNTEVNSKTISSNGDLTIENGSFNLNSQDDAIHSNANIVINNGTFTINAGDDAIHSDYDCTINGGNIDIQNSYEGIEGANIYINDGTIKIVSSDDGFNGSDSNSTSSNSFGGSTGYIEFNGGSTYINASGDGIDSNGDMVFNDGTIIVEGPTNGADGPLDCGDNQNAITVNGGNLIAGGSKQMFEIPDSTSEQNVIYCLNLSAEADSCIVLVDQDNNIIDKIYNTKVMESIIFSSSAIETGKTYHIYKDVTLSEDGTFLNGSEIGSVEVTNNINQIGEGTIFNFGFHEKNRNNDNIVTSVK